MQRSKVEKGKEKQKMKFSAHAKVVWKHYIFFVFYFCPRSFKENETTANDRKSEKKRTRERERKIVCETFKCLRLIFCKATHTEKGKENLRCAALHVHACV